MNDPDYILRPEDLAKATVEIIEKKRKGQVR
jgi:hypothetical protein